MRDILSELKISLGGATLILKKTTVLKIGANPQKK
jgi:hypothetical protein